MASEFERNKRLTRNLVNAQKMRDDIITNEDLKRQEQPKIEAPKDFKGKMSNWWYHNKIPVFIGSIALCVVIMLVCGLAIPQKFDGSFTIVSEISYMGSESFIKPTITDYAQKVLNKERKKIKINYANFYIPSNVVSADVDTQFVSYEQAKLVGRLSTAEGYIYAVDDFNYKQLKEIGIEFKDLSQYSDNKNVEGDRFKLNGTKLGTALKMPDKDMYLCLVDFDKFDEKAKKKKNLAKQFKTEEKMIIEMLKNAE